MLRHPAADGDTGRDPAGGMHDGRLVVPWCIQERRRVRRQFVGSLSPRPDEWVIRPLLDAGLGLDRIRDLLFRLGFEAIVSGGRGTAAQVSTMISSEPPHVQAAWHEVIGRMLSMHRSNA